ncbi:hypothetical protein BRC68_14160 [Halobacteriales archaeon QH_6_64_20]|nr:MAG: hypothetical protein BRC68_14160 [Halobacteriales archaeon QH_6_64_20]
MVNNSSVAINKSVARPGRSPSSVSVVDRPRTPTDDIGVRWQRDRSRFRDDRTATDGFPVGEDHA